MIFCVGWGAMKDWKDKKLEKNPITNQKLCTSLLV